MHVIKMELLAQKMKLAIEKKQHTLACEKGVGDAMLVTIGFSKGACRMVPVKMIIKDEYQR